MWLIDFEPVQGAEMNKVRPAVVVSSDSVGRLPIKLVAPITGWQAHFVGNVWHVRVEPTKSNGLSKESAVDALQIRAVSIERFRTRLGRLTADQMEQIAAAIAIVVEHT